MGCDIHIYSEIKLPEPGSSWVHADGWIKAELPYLRKDNGESMIPLWVGRNYGVFGYLAGVRTNPEMCFRFGVGLPEDISPGVRKIFDEDEHCWHTPGHCTLMEFRAALSKVTDPFTENDEDEDPYNSYLHLHRILKTMERRLEIIYPGLSEHNFRIVFWFDS